jgi:nucleoside-diphosphate kinase
MLGDYRKTRRTEETFGLVKPEALERGLAGEIDRRVRLAGLAIEERKKLVLSRRQAEFLYGHIKGRLPEVYSQMEDYLISKPSEVLRVRGPDAVAVLLAVRGASNPSDALPNTIRGDYAKDQDYRRKGQISFNVFHSSDSKEDAEKMLKLFFGGPQ